MKRFVLTALTLLMLLSQLAWAEHIYTDHDIADSCEYCLKLQSHDTIAASPLLAIQINPDLSDYKHHTLSTRSAKHHRNIRAPPAIS